ncbi:MAG TPA: FecR family protein [Myxococcaceae bacterium]|nr:FecR family protein [Myxococcaceae bacterium]
MKPLSVALLLVPCLAFGSVGKVSLLKGQATRTPRGGAAEAIKQGAEVELGDTLTVGQDSDVKITLNDESLLLVGANSTLRIDEAKFEGLERKAFSARLVLGKVWAKVTKAVSGSDAKFEVTTDRAVAGVRGTVFRVDATKLLSAASSSTAPLPKKGVQTQTTVKVSVGRVAVEAMVRNMAMGATPPPGETGSATTGTSPGTKTAAATPPAGGKKERKQVAGPQQISKEQWEKKFVELQQHQAITVGEELWQQADWSPEQDKDEFATFIAQAGQ